MPANEDRLFRKIALARGYCTQQQIDECLQMQKFEESPPPLEELLLYKGYITPEQSKEVLSARERMPAAEDPATRVLRESVLFGKLSVREGLATKDQVSECLRLQAREGERRSLGEILVQKGYLNPAQVQNLLALQLKKIMECPACKLSFTVVTLSKFREVLCPKCKGLLSEKIPPKSARTDAEFATTMIRTVRAGFPPDLRKDARQIPPGARKVQVTCVICDKAFEGQIDSTGRVRCPDCHTIFTPK